LSQEKILIKVFIFFTIIFSYFSLFIISLHALTSNEILRLKEAGVDDRTIQLLIELEKTQSERLMGLGIKEIERPDGGKDRIHYSITSPEEELRIQEDERKKMEKAWEILRNIIIERKIIIDERKR